MTELAFKIGEQDAGERMDTVLSRLMEDASRNSIQKLIEKGSVTVNGDPVTSKKHKLLQGDTVEVSFEPPAPLEAFPENIPLDIVYEDHDLLVVNKPKGMVVHPAVGNFSGTLVNAVLYHCGSRLSSINGIIRPGIVHRIDKDTSGLLVIAKNDKAHRSLAKQLASHTMTRAYRAIVHSNFSEDQGTVTGAIGRDPGNRLRMAVTSRNSKEATTHYRVLERFGRFTYIEAILETGRTHQIRVHMAHINHPVFGDELYGPKKGTMKGQRQMLHAKTLGFHHPSTDVYMEFDSPLPEDFERILAKLRKESSLRSVKG